jgi:hypothetical protein
MADEDEDLIIDLNEKDEDAAAKEAEKSPRADERAPTQAKPPPVPGPASKPPPSTAPQTGLKDLESQIVAERAAKNRVAEENRRLQAERDQAILFAQEAERRGMSTFELYNENQIRAAEEQLDALTMQQEAAMNDGDFKAAADLNRKMQRLGGQLALLERDKATLAQQRETMKVQHQRKPQPTRQPAEAQPTDPLERAIAGRTEPTKQFLRKHPELIRGDGSLKRAAIDAHERALDEGHAVDTPGYFSFIEGLIGTQGHVAGEQTGREAVTNGQGQPPREARQRAPTMAAPVERGAGPGSSGEAGTFVMTPKMRRLADEQGVPPKEWAQNYVRLLKEGRITPIT